MEGEREGEREGGREYKCVSADHKAHALCHTVPVMFAAYVSDILLRLR